jgi:hypothetical protein
MISARVFDRYTQRAWMAALSDRSVEGFRCQAAAHTVRAESLQTLEQVGNRRSRKR